MIPEVWGMHEHIKDMARRFAHAGYFAVTFEPYARQGGTMHLSEQSQVIKVANSVPDAGNPAQDTTRDSDLSTQNPPAQLSPTLSNGDSNN